MTDVQAPVTTLKVTVRCSFPHPTRPGEFCNSLLGIVPVACLDHGIEFKRCGRCGNITLLE